MKITAIIAAAGQGSRMGGQGKQFKDLEGKPIVGWALTVFEESDLIDEIILVVNEKDMSRAKKTVEDLKIKKIKKIIEGGKERQDSVFAGIKEVKPDTDIVIIHDGARPFVTKEIISRAVNDAKEHGAAVVAVPAIDTIKSSKKGNLVQETIDRTNLWLIQTPQVFKYKIIKEAYERAYKIKYRATDDSKLVERMGIPVKITKGSYENIKITTPDDLMVAWGILKVRQ